MSYISVGCPSSPVLTFLEEWTTETLEEISASVIPKVSAGWNCFQVARPIAAAKQSPAVDDEHHH